MKIVGCDEDGLQQASRTLRSGGVVAYPTDTVYGLGCDPRKPHAIRRIFEVKGRERKPLPVLFSNLENLRRVVHMTPVADNLATRFWPGPLTIVCRLLDPTLDETVALGTGKLGVRIPNHTCTLKLIELCGGALVGTSANQSGETAAKSAAEVVQGVGENVDVIIDSGPTALGRESTVVDVSGGVFKIIREGHLSAAELLSGIRKVSQFHAGEMV